MGFFSRMQRMMKSASPTGGIEVIAPVSGEVVDIEKVPDVVFSRKIIGDGIAIDPDGDTIYAPIDGTIGKIFESNHAFSIESPLGLELFVHFGIDTVELRGNGFERIAQEGQRVKAGDPVLKFDLDYLRQHAKSVLTPLVIANMEDVKDLHKAEGKAVGGETPALQVFL
ncbi:PTS glucose transporter subunit IIA [Ferrimonas sp. SCSIO 43195]|uniref:PTS glucose transporter subunit IIA n=1 Tax=Ferrimonas sp. SCSIO 43195 TaxID=2822844 RepID=UPI002075859C|nr:PTS glucose transporter subunit IIA [Ferrimonas sp. SCSIO 43195]USD35969.1 PTS glucose transporter subunit IIA [Ferrimonas sp. SCSIO 43195]